MSDQHEPFHSGWSTGRYGKGVSRRCVVEVSDHLDRGLPATRICGQSNRFARSCCGGCQHCVWYLPEPGQGDPHDGGFAPSPLVQRPLVIAAVSRIPIRLGMSQHDDPVQHGTMMVRLQTDDHYGCTR